MGYADYYAAISKVESGNNPLAKNPNSSASGLYQFTKGTWESLGYNWADRFDVGKQNQAIEQLTTQNANILESSGIAVNNANLYAAHVFGAGTAKKVLSQTSDTPLSNILSANVLKANPIFKGMNVGDLSGWLQKKVGGSGGSSGGSSGSKVAAYASAAAMLASGNPIGAALAIAGAQGKDKKPNALEQFLTWIKELFSVNTAARFVFIVIGLALLALAIGALVAENKDTIVNVAAKGAALVA